MRPPASTAVRTQLLSCVRTAVAAAYQTTAATSAAALSSSAGVTGRQCGSDIRAAATPGRCAQLHTSAVALSSAAAASAEHNTTAEVGLEAATVFESCWRRVVAQHAAGNERNLRPPREIVWLNGAPGSGKGANTPFVLQSRGFDARAIVISELLAKRPETRAIMDAGGLIDDAAVVTLLLQELLFGPKGVHATDNDTSGDDKDSSHYGMVVDGFPRTSLQVDIVRLLYDRLLSLHLHLHSPHFPRPVFRIAVLYVDEAESVRRGEAAVRHNERVRERGVGEYVEERETDKSEMKARGRLKQHFAFHLIDATVPLPSCALSILRELRYQSCLELSESTWSLIRTLPTPSDLVNETHANVASLPARLDEAVKKRASTMQRVMRVVDREGMEAIGRGGMAGEAIFVSQSPTSTSAPSSSASMMEL
eukprot:jgi/Chlat1/8785/Chrsp90S08133